MTDTNFGDSESRLRSVEKTIPYSVLLVEDNPDHATLAKASLDKELDCVIQVAPSLNKAFMHITTQHFDVIIVDHYLPDGSGLDLVDWVPPECAVVLITSQGDDRLAAQAFRRGVNDYVPKDSLLGHALPEAVSRAVETARSEKSPRPLVLHTK